MNGIIDLITTYLPYALLAISGFFALVGAIGIIRMPDVYNRIHAETLCVFGGSIVGLIAIAILAFFKGSLKPLFSLKAIIIALFLFFTNPVGSHAIARAAHKSGVGISPESNVDKLKEVEE